jgi:predicted TIM-barrel fold metal-dependent hydrolase
MNLNHNPVMSKKFINIHSHIFTVSHAPDFFLQTVIPDRDFAETVQRLLQKKGTRFLIKFLKLFFWGHKRGLLEKYIGFIEIGISSTQEEIFKIISNSYKKYGDFGIVTLAQVLDTLDLEDRDSTHKNVKTQIQEILEIKRNAAYQNHILPFLPVDPRTSFTLSTTEWLGKYINADAGFCGVKIYPGVGFYPYDIRLDPVWEWIEKNQVPVMTHCTRVGSFYLGTQASILSSGGFHVESLNPTSPSMPGNLNRIRLTLENQSIVKKNGMWCNVFGNPTCYEPVLEKYPKLKICFAHLGGSTEIIRSDGDKPLEGYPIELVDNNWYIEVLRLMKTYRNVYSDISYTLHNDDAMKIIAKKFKDENLVDDFGVPLLNKLMYGTDFYMTQQEKEGTEALLQNNFTDAFNDTTAVNLMAYTNPAKFLENNIFEVLH